MDTFIWPVRLGSSGQIEQRVQTNEFGDGYMQVIGVGLNNQVESWEVSATGYFGDAPDITPVREFLDRHRGSKSFLWTPPAGKAARFRATSYRLLPHGKGVYTLSWTFQQVFYP